MLAPEKHGNRWRLRPVDPVTGERKTLSFKDLKEAKLVAAKLNLELERVKNGHLVEERLPDKTFGELCDYWLSHRAVQKRSREDDESIIGSRLRPEFGVLLLRQLTVEHVDRYAAKVIQPHVDERGVKRGPIGQKTLSNHLTLLKTLLNTAVDLGWLAKAPRIKKPKVRMFSTDYAYLRTTEEIERFLRTAREEGEAAFVLYATAVFTGMRAGELAGLEWADVNFDQRLITVQRSFDGPTKAGDVRYVPILDPLLPILQAWRLRQPGRLVFTNRDGAQLGESGRIFQDVFKRVLKTAGFAERDVGGKRRPAIRFHDLRHTFASHWVMNGGDIYKLQKILGHKTVQMTMRYAHLRRDAFAGDLDRMGSRDLLSSTAAVVPLRRQSV